ncbi:sodium/hydrogen exchanger 1 isoform X3 [Daucus carota subsp. sativus]|uniref:sodium/hydrogen exchanger 1 isoform X3 n=1 Tax=Daucus carota subsp. sativus TaxID=79200 RepID=UPI00308307B4
MTNPASVDNITLFVALICVCIVIGHLLVENKWTNESTTPLFLGLCSGVVILLSSGGTNSRIFEFDEQLFFIYLLPPIIFNAGCKVFNRNAEYWLFGDQGLSRYAVHPCIAIDPPVFQLEQFFRLQILYTPCSILFGEGVVNDATSVVLFHAIQKYDLSDINVKTAFQFGGTFLFLFTTSTLLGVSVGLLSAFIMKKLHPGRHSSDREMALMILMAYLSYMMAELFDLSGILTAFFCGLVMSHYAWHSMTDGSKVATRHAFATFSFICEICIFLYVGMDALDLEKWNFVSSCPAKSVGMSALLLGLVLIGRASFVFPLSFISNLTKKSTSYKLNLKQQVIIWWAGLMRGVVSMTLAYNQFTRFGHTQQQANAIILTSTMTVVLFSTMVFGLMTKPLVRLLMPPPILNRNVLSSEPSSPNTLPLLHSSQDPESDTEHEDIHRSASLSRILSTTSNTIHRYWRKYDDRYMRPLFGGREVVHPVPASSTNNDSQ